MIESGLWVPNSQNLATFILADNNGAEVVGLGGTFNVFIGKGTAALVPALGTTGEKGLGWYWYLSTALDADTVGPVNLSIQGAGTTQQNLEYVCGSRVPSAKQFTYTVTDQTTALPVAGVQVSFTPDVGGLMVVWSGFTDVFGVAKDVYGNLPMLQPGTYYVWRNKPGYLANDPDQEVVI